MQSHSSKNFRDPFEQGMNRYHAFQAETLRVHAHYLQGQLEYTGAFLKNAEDGFIASQTITTPSTLDSTIRIRPVKLKSLPHPDQLEIVIPQHAVCLITDDGTPTPSVLATALSARGWSIAILSSSIVSDQTNLPNGIPAIVLDGLDEEDLKTKLDTLPEPVGAFIHLHPRIQADSILNVSTKEEAVVKLVFLLAKYLKMQLVQSAQHAHSFFITVTRLDGQLGMGKRADFSPLGGGLSGLVKSLNLEWDHVFCRAVDLSPSIKTEHAVQMLLAELCDPDQTIVEVGCGPQGRFTLVCK